MPFQRRLQITNTQSRYTSCITNLAHSPDLAMHSRNESGRFGPRLELGGNRKSRIAFGYMNKPNPDMFGRIVLTDLASIYAEAARTRMILELIARHLKIPNIDKTLEMHAMGAEKSARELSAEALKNAGFEK